MPSITSIDAIFDYFAKKGVELTPRSRGGLNGYKHAFHAWGDTLILNYDGRGSDPDAMGCHASISGEGLRYIEHLGLTIPRMIKDLLALGAKFRRLDVAYDTQEVKMSTVYEAYKNESVRGDFRSNSMRYIDDKASGGQTVYFGSRTSLAFCRVYDKKAESSLQGMESLVRFEYEFKREKAEFIAAIIADERWEDVMAYCKQVVQFCENCHDSNRSRWKEASWFTELFNVGKLKMAINKLVSDVLARKVRFMDRSVATNLLAYKKAGYLDKFLDDLESHAHRLKDTHFAMIQAAKKLSYREVNAFAH
ncbi:MAG: replication initiation factor domain-containing protein [Armatimonadota bacterium]